MKRSLLCTRAPHAYISSSWYKSEKVPTWNHQSVHVYGTASIRSEQELQADLILRLQKDENHRKNAVLWENLSLQTQKQIKGIVGFKVKRQEIQVADKLNQNRNEEDDHNIVNKLYEEKDLNSQQLAERMKNKEWLAVIQYSKNGKSVPEVTEMTGNNISRKW